MIGRVPRQHNFLDGSNSSLTGQPWFVADFDKLVLSIQSSTGSASRYTVVGALHGGLRTSLPNASALVHVNGWSILTTLTSQGMYTLDSGMRWVNVFRDAISVSAASNVTISIKGSY